MPKSTKLTTAHITALNRKRKSSVGSIASHTKSLETLTEEQIEKAREATRHKFEEILIQGETNNADDKELEKISKISAEIELHIFQVHGKIDMGYKTDFRRLFTSLKDTKTNYRLLLLDSKISGTEFASMSFEQLLSDQRRESDATIKQEAIRLSTLAEPLPSDIASFKDGREREKWGIGKSAASVDEEES